MVLSPNPLPQPSKNRSIPTSERLALTILVSGDRDGCELLGGEAELRDAVGGLDLEGVVDVGHEVEHGDGGVGEPRVPWDEADAAAADLALAGVRAALLAHHAVGEVLPAPRVARGAPLQHQSCLVDVKNHVPRSRRWPCRQGGENLLSQRYLLWRKKLP